jgi:hypothetical protein
MAQLLALYKTAESAAQSTEALEGAGITNEEFDILTDSPYPEGAFGEKEPQHKLYVFPFMGACIGFTLAMIETIGTQTAYPLVTGGKPIFSMPAMTIIAYELTMLGAIIATVIGIFFESRIPNPFAGIYDERITEGYIGITVVCDDSKLDSLETLLKSNGAEDIIIEKQS